MSTRQRSLGGLAVAGLAFAVLLAAGGELYRAWEAGAPPAATRTPRERAFAVEVGTLDAQTVTPMVTAYGRLIAGRSLELRSAVAGPLIELNENFRDGGRVTAGDVLFRIDPSRLESARALAKSNLAEAEADLTEARATLDLARLEADAAQTQLELRDAALARQEDLRSRGVATEADVEAAVLARSSAEQTLINRRQVVTGDEARLAQAGIVLERQRAALADAERAVEDATVMAPFDGVISAPQAIAGRLVSANEVLGTLVDPAEIEVSFRLTNTHYARLLNGAGALRNAEVVVELRSGRNVIETPAELVRVGAEVGENEVGRLIYARLTAPDPAQLRPGDFVTVRIPERPLENVAVIPAGALSADGQILLVGPGNRLEEATVSVLRHQGDDVIVGDAPFGSQYVRARALQLGAGIQVEPQSAAAPAAAAAPAPAPEAEAAPATIALDGARRAAIIDFINASEQMKPEMREKFLEELSRPEVPVETVERFEAKMLEGQ